MDKNKEKHHAEDKAKRDAPEPGQPTGGVHEAAHETPSGHKAHPAAGPAETAPGIAGLPPQPRSAEAKLHEGESAKTEHGAERLQKAAQEIERLKDQLLRLRADFDNYRKRALREKNEIYENANEALMLELLPIIDHLQLAINSAKEHKASAAFQDGLQLIADQLMSTLAKYGLNPFHSEKQPFDTNLHEAVSCLPSETEPEGTIIAQSRQGYRFKNKILRPAQVVVAGGKSMPPQVAPNHQPPAED